MIELAPTLDRLDWQFPVSSDGRLAEVAGQKMKFYRHFVSDRTVRSDLVVVSTLNLAF